MDLLSRRQFHEFAKTAGDIGGKSKDSREIHQREPEPLPGAILLGGCAPALRAADPGLLPAGHHHQPDERHKRIAS